MKLTRRQLRRIILESLSPGTVSGRTRKVVDIKPQSNVDIKAVLNIPALRCLNILGSLVACVSDYRLNHVTKQNPDASVLYNLTDEASPEVVNEIIASAALTDPNTYQPVKTPKFRMFRSLTYDKTAIVEKSAGGKVYVGMPTNPDFARESQQVLLTIKFPCVIHPEHGCIDGEPVRVYGNKDRAMSSEATGDYAMVKFGAIKHKDEWYYTLPLHGTNVFSPYDSNEGQRAISSSEFDCGWRDEKL